LSVVDCKGQLAFKSFHPNSPIPFFSLIKIAASSPNFSLASKINSLGISKCTSKLFVKFWAVDFILLPFIYYHSNLEWDRIVILNYGWNIRIMPSGASAISNQIPPWRDSWDIVFRHLSHNFPSSYQPWLSTMRSLGLKFICLSVGLPTKRTKDQLEFNQAPPSPCSLREEENDTSLYFPFPRFSR